MSISVGGTRSMTISSDGRPVTNENPRLPLVTASRIQSRYWIGMGWSSPSAARYVAADALDVLGREAARLAQVEQQEVDRVHRRQPHQREHEEA